MLFFCLFFEASKETIGTMQTFKSTRDHLPIQDINTNNNFPWMSSYQINKALAPWYVPTNNEKKSCIAPIFDIIIVFHRVVRQSLLPTSTCSVFYFLHLPRGQIYFWDLTFANFLLSGPTFHA